MPKETTVFIICLLALCSDALLVWQTANLRLGEKPLLESFSSGGAMLAVLISLALGLLWLSYLLLRRIISRTFD